MKILSHPPNPAAPQASALAETRASAAHTVVPDRFERIATLIGEGFRAFFHPLRAFAGMKVLGLGGLLTFMGLDLVVKIPGMHAPLGASGVEIVVAGPTDLGIIAAATCFVFAIGADIYMFTVHREGETKLFREILLDRSTPPNVLRNVYRKLGVG